MSARATAASLAPLLLLLLPIGPTGCAGREAAVQQGVPASASGKTAAWVGRTEKDIVAVYGRPSRRVETADGGAIVYYRTVDPEAEAKPPLKRTPEIKLSYEAKFWLDGKGEVYRIWMSPSALTEHYRPPE